MITGVELIIAPLLVAGSTLACRWWDARIGGLISAFPAVIGAVLLITAHDRGASFTARAADGTLLGLVALSGFAVAYSRLAVRAGWGTSLLAGWGCAAVLAAVVAWACHGVGLLIGLIIATVSLAVAHRAIPALHGDADAIAPTQLALGEIPPRMALTAVLVAVLEGAAELLGPFFGGMLAGLPVLAYVLAVFTHRRHGPATVVTLLRGMLAGMAGFVGFCAIVALLIVPAGIGPAFAAATLTAVALQALVADRASVGRWASRAG